MKFTGRLVTSMNDQGKAINAVLPREPLCRVLNVKAIFD